MQVPSAEFVFSHDGARVTVYPGSLIGRLAKADVVIADPRVSEAHALVSLRNRSLQMLALRGALMIDGREVDAVTLERGLKIELADGLSVTVEGVELPTHTLVLCGTTQGPVELGVSTHSLLPTDGSGPPTLRLVAGYVPDAACHLWYSGSRLWIHPRSQEAEPIQTGGSWTIDGCPLRVIQLPLDGARETAPGEPQLPVEPTNLVIIAHYATVHVQRGGATSILTGKPANLVSELVSYGGKPVPWDMLSQPIWREQHDRTLLRDSFDATLARLRRQLRDLAIREDLVSLDGLGNVELVLYPGDRTIDAA